MRKIELLKAILFFLVSLLTLVSPAATDAAEIELFDGFEPGQKLILVRGPIETGDDERFYELAEQADRAIVFLESPGGIVDAGLSIGAEVAMKGFTTLVLDGDGCHSICAIIWISGARRYMSPNARISVHAAYRLETNTDGQADAAESGVANADIGAYLNELGLSRQAIYYFTLARPEEPLLPITPEIAQLLDIEVYIQDGEQVIAPSERPSPRQITRQVTEYLGMANNCDGLFGVDPNFWKRQAEVTLKSGHDLFGGEAFGQLLPEYSSELKAALKRDGIVVWCISAEANLRRDGLQTGLVGPSFDCSHAGTPTELSICNSQDLWALDNSVASLYFFYRRNQSADRGAEFLESQKAWLKLRDRCGANLDCLIEQYISRIFDFHF